MLSEFKPYIWGPEFEVGISLVDQQHKVLIDITNELGEAVFEGRAKHIISDIIFKLIEYTKTHFSAEEVMLEAISFSDISAHKKQHEYFINYMVEFRQGVLTGEKNGADLHDFLGKWLITHILQRDTAYVTEVNGNKKPVEKGFFSKFFRK